MYSIKTMDYFFCDEYEKISLDSLYDNNEMAIKNLRYNLMAIITTEAPINLNVLKERLRDAFSVQKISQKALDIIMYHIKDIGFPITRDQDDITIWSLDGIYDVKFLRINSNRNIYDIPSAELLRPFKIIKETSGLNGYDLEKEILAYFGYEVLTKKASERIEYIFEKIKEI